MVRKTCIAAVAAVMLLAGLAVAQTGMQDVNQPETMSSTVQQYIGGQHSPLIFTGSDTLAKGGVANPTRWMQIGWSPSTAPRWSNELSQRYNPEFFSFILGEITPYPTHADNDSGGIGQACFEVAYDTTADAIWNGDTTNFFIKDGNFDRVVKCPLYEGFNRVATDTTDFSYQLAVQHGAFIRFWLWGWNNAMNGSILDDSCIVEWKFVGEN